MPKKKQPKAKVHLTHVRVFTSDISLVVGTHEQLKDWVREALTENKKKTFLPQLEARVPEDTCLATTYDLKGGGSVIWMPRYTPEVFVHELIHAVGNLFEAKGLNLSRENEETYAYLVQDLYHQLKMH